MADAEIRPLLKDASSEDIIRGVNTALGILRGNIPGHFSLLGSDGVSRDIRGGATLDTGLYTLKIRSEAGDHFTVRHSGDLADVFVVRDEEISLAADLISIVGAPARIQSQFSDAVLAQRTLFQSYIVNGATNVGAIPNGTSTQAGWEAFNNAAPGSATVQAVMRASSSAMELRSESPGASAQPMDFYTNATHQWRLDTAGALIAQGTGKRIMGDLSNATLANRLMVQNSTANAVSNLGIMPNGTGAGSTLSVFNSSTLTATQVGQWQITATEIRIQSHHIGASYLPMTFYNAGAEQARVSEAGGFRVTAMDPPLHDTQVTPGSQCKAYAYVTGGGGATLGQNYNIASVTRNGVGDFTVTIDRDFSAATYAVVATVQDNAANLIWRVNGQAAGSFDVHFRDAAAAFALTDPDGFSVACFGTLV